MAIYKGTRTFAWATRSVKPNSDSDANSTHADHAIDRKSTWPEDEDMPLHINTFITEILACLQIYLPDPQSRVPCIIWEFRNIVSRITLVLLPTGFAQLLQDISLITHVHAIVCIIRLKQQRLRVGLLMNSKIKTSSNYKVFNNHL
jgi:hypothetical protein